MMIGLAVAGQGTGSIAATIFYLMTYCAMTVGAFGVLSVMGPDVDDVQDLPLAAHATVAGESVHLRAAWGDPEGRGALVRVEAMDMVADLDAAAALGERVAAQLRAGGAH